MSINQEFEVRTRHITPSARPSIHPQSKHIVSGHSMNPERMADVDEVDNIVSKLSHTNHSTPVIKSHHQPDKYDSEEHSALAKSLPAKLPSASNDSDHLERLCMESRSRQLNKSGSASPRANWSGWASPWDNWSGWASPRDNWSGWASPRDNWSGSTSPRVPGPGPWSVDSSSSFASISPNVSHNFNQSAQDRQRKESSGGTVNLLGLIGLLAVFAAYYYDMFSSARESKVTYDEVRFQSDLNELGAKYKVGDESILQLQAGISTIFKNEDTSCVLFLYNSQKNNFDPIRFDGFVNNVVSNSAKFLRNDTAPSEPKVVEGAELTMLTHSQLVSAFKEDIARTGVILVKDVGGVPSPLAMAFHYYCDEFQPLVEKSAIFFTLNTARCHNSGEKSSHASVEKCLKEKWNTVPQDNIGALLTRVVNIVVDVNGGE